MARIPTASRESVPQDQLSAFDELVSQRGNVPDTGPISVMINVPELTKRGEHLRAYIRGDESSLSANVRELAMILTAREMDCQFIWNAHAAFGRQAGLSDELVNNLRDKRTSQVCRPKSRRWSTRGGRSSAPIRSAKPHSTPLSLNSGFVAWWN